MNLRIKAMIKNELLNINMNADSTGDWIQIGSQQEPIDKFSITVNATSVAGTKDGTLDLYVSNDLDNQLGGSHTQLTINAATYNESIEISVPYHYIKFVYMLVSLNKMLVIKDKLSLKHAAV